MFYGFCNLFPGSDSHKIIGILAKTSLGSLTGVAHNVAYLGELEIIGIITIDIILIRLYACSWAIYHNTSATKNHLWNYLFIEWFSKPSNSNTKRENMEIKNITLFFTGIAVFLLGAFVVIFDYPQIQYFEALESESYYLLEQEKRDIHQRLIIEFSIGIGMLCVGVALLGISFFSDKLKNRIR